MAHGHADAYQDGDSNEYYCRECMEKCVLEERFASVPLRVEWLLDNYIRNSGVEEWPVLDKDDEAIYVRFNKREGKAELVDGYTKDAVMLIRYGGSVDDDTWNRRKEIEYVDEEDVIETLKEDIECANCGDVLIEAPRKKCFDCHETVAVGEKVIEMLEAEYRPDMILCQEDYEDSLDGIRGAIIEELDEKIANWIIKEDSEQEAARRDLEILQGSHLHDLPVLSLVATNIVNSWKVEPMYAQYFTLKPAYERAKELEQEY